MSPAPYRIECAFYLRDACVGQKQAYNLGMMKAIVEDAYEANFEGEYEANLYLYDDSGFSGRDEDRPALQRLLLDIRERHIDAVVFLAASALARSIEQMTSIVEHFALYNTQLILIPAGDLV